MNATRNSPRTAMRLWLILVILGGGLALAPLVFPVGFRAGGMMAMGGASVAVLSLVMACISRQRARRLDRIIAGDGVLAHWVYDEALWRRHAEHELAGAKSNRRILWAIIAGVFAVPAVGVLVLTQASAVALLGVGGFYLLMWAAARTIAHITRRREASRPPEAYIATGAVLIGGRLHRWDSWAHELAGAAVSASEPDMLEITYLYVPRPSTSRTVVRIPIPAGRQEEARRICALLLARRTE